MNSNSLILLLVFSKLTECVFVGQNVHLCPGDNFSKMCSTNYSYLEWNVYFPRSRELYRFSVSRYGSNSYTVTARNTRCDIIRNSDPGVLPITSTLLLNSVTSDINGAQIYCIGIDINYHTTPATMIHVINVHPPGPEVSISQRYAADYLTVGLEWSEENGVSYNVSTEPQVAIAFNGSSAIQFIALYNTVYDVNITASSVICDTTHTVTTTAGFNYTKCGYPAESLSEFEDSSVRINGYQAPMLEGSSLTLSCCPGLELVGPNTTTCMENGEWEPDPRQVECKVTCGSPSPPLNGWIFPYNSTIEGAGVDFMCEVDDSATVRSTVCNASGNWEPNPAQVCKSDTVNCGAPSLPPDGLIFPYNSTTEGASIDFVCQVDDLAAKIAMICNASGNWDPSPTHVCKSTIGTDNLRKRKVGLNGDILVGVVVSTSLIFYLLSVLVFCLLGFICGWCCRKQRQLQNLAQVSRHTHRAKTLTNTHPPAPMYPAPVYEQVLPMRAEVDDGSDHKCACHLDDIDTTAKPLSMSKNKAYSTSLKNPTPIYEDVLPVGGGEKMKVTEQIELQDLKMKRNDAYGPV